MRFIGSSSAFWAGQQQVDIDVPSVAGQWRLMHLNHINGTVTIFLQSFVPGIGWQALLNPLWIDLVVTVMAIPGIVVPAGGQIIAPANIVVGGVLAVRCWFLPLNCKVQVTRIGVVPPPPGSSPFRYVPHTRQPNSHSAMQVIPGAIPRNGAILLYGIQKQLWRKL